MVAPDAEFAEYFNARAPGLRRLAFSLCGDWHTADDLVQTTFVKLYGHWRRVRSGAVDAYTRRILINSYLSHRRNLRREHVTPDVPELAAPGELPDPSREIARALAALPARQRAVVVLRHLEDLSVTEVADLLGIAEGTVKSQTARGVAALREALGQPEPSTSKE